MRVVTIVGARPQFIKAAAVSRHLRQPPDVEELLVHTGQHYDDNMSQVFFDELGIPKPDFHLGVGSGSHGEMTGKMLAAIEKILLETKPDWVMVYGDTNSTLAGALAAVKLHIPIAHVEAGVRSFNRRMPEEINRVLTDHAADLLLAPSDTAVENLRCEGIPRDSIQLVGDVMYDVALYFAEQAEATSDILNSAALEPKQYVLATVHRAENTDDPGRLRAIFSALSRTAEAIPVVLPLHPRTRAALLREGLLDNLSPDLRLIEPVGYLDMIKLERNARLIATDSGGVQKEAFFHGVPCVTLRDETEWVELVEVGWNRLVAPEDEQEVFDAIATAMNSPPGEAPENFYGGGKAAQAICACLGQPAAAT